jgi:hypothetical protein
VTALTLLAAVTALSPQAPSEPVNLGRVFAKNERLFYQVRSGLTAEQRMPALRQTTWMPEDFDINYNFTMHVQEMRQDGIAVLNYKRPSMTFIEGETMDSPPKSRTENVNLDLLLTVSPINEMIDMKDLAPPKPAARSGGRSGSFTIASTRGVLDDPLSEILDQFVGEMYRLTLFAGSLDSALDLSPKLNRPTVKVGDTWRRTVGYQPQRLQGKDGKSVVQRLDFEYVYKGEVTVDGKKFHRVEASYDLKTDLADFINDTFEVDAGVTGISKLPLNLKSTVKFDLDPVTRHTTLAQAETQGGYQIFVTEMRDVPVMEMRLRGRTTLTLANRAIRP